MNEVRIAVVGMGNAGALHARALVGGDVPGARLAALVCSPARLPEVAVLLTDGVRHFPTLDALLAERPLPCDAVILATPHPLHPAQTVAALTAGLHVFCEKPAGVRAREAREMAETARRHGRVYSLNFNRRVVPLYRHLRDLARGGRIGELRRVQWTSTYAWLRVQAYYDSSPWRGTWAGEGGGLLLNQWPHVLDLWQWICGMPSRLRASCGFGRHHAIEVEDEVSVFAEYANGATAFLVGSTGEAPGTERLEIVGDRGRVVAEGDVLRVTLLESGGVGGFIARSPAGFARPPVREEVCRFDDEGDLVAGVTRDFVAAVAAGDGRRLLAPGEDGVASLALANAALLSSWEDSAWVSLPLTGETEERFERCLDERIAASHTRAIAPAAALSLEESFRRG